LLCDPELIHNQANDWVAGKPAKELTTHNWTTHHWLHFLRQLPNPIKTEQMAIWILHFILPAAATPKFLPFGYSASLLTNINPLMQ